MYVFTDLFELAFHTDEPVPATGMCKIVYMGDAILAGHSVSSE